MRIVIKTLQGSPTQYEVVETDTVAELKKRVATEQKIDVGQIKLIHEGTVLAEEKKQLSDYGIKDNDFLVLMVAKVSILVTILYRPSLRLKKHLLPSLTSPSLLPPVLECSNL